MNFIKKKRSFSIIREYGFLFTFLVAIGGLFYPKLGLLVLLIMLGLLVTSFFNAKFWCGNICPHGSYFDNIILPMSRNTKIPKFFKNKIFSYGFFVFFLFNLGRKFLAISQYFGTMTFLDKLGSIFSTTYLMVMIVGGLIGLITTPRTWCQICPMGTMEKLSYGFGKLIKFKSPYEKRITISDTSLCKNCGLCYKVCPMQIDVNNNFNQHNQISDINCIKCKTCINNCPMKILSLKEAEV